MPLFTPDVLNRALGRPNLLWFAPSSDSAKILGRRFDGQWVVLEVPTPQERAEYQYLFDSGRENYVTYHQVRDWDLTELGRVRYVDDYDDQWTDVYVSRDNDPFARATTPEPVWSAT